MKDSVHRLQARIESLRLRIETLSSLQDLVHLPPACDITHRQWAVLNTELKAVEARLLRWLKAATRASLARAGSPAGARALNAQLGEIELEMAQAFTFFDTYMDVLTQRHTPELGRLLAGCDVLAWDAIHKEHPALAVVEPPLVNCDRGFAASTIREYVPLPGRGHNPMPLIQIPYARLKEKCNLTSVLHEVGHEAMVRLGLVSELPAALRSKLAGAGAPQHVVELYALWCSEIGPDFWAFCAAGIAGPGGEREILALPPHHALRISWLDPHPPPYLRVLISFDWCRQIWGSGIWNDWESDWLMLYPLEDTSAATQELLQKAVRYIPIVSSVLLHTKFHSLNGKSLPDLFNLEALAPAELRRTAETVYGGCLDLKGLPPAAHLAVFRLIKEQGKLDEESLDRLMTHWLLRLAERRKRLGAPQATLRRAKL